jgi:hypothetical protein
MSPGRADADFRDGPQKEEQSNYSVCEPGRDEVNGLIT